MRCPECSSDDTHEFFAEEINCSHCDEINVITYNVCEECNLVWKAVDGSLVDKLAYIEETFDVADVPFEDVINKPSMQDLIHRCLRCGCIAYEVKEKQYHCPSCGFEWGVM